MRNAHALALFLEGEFTLLVVVLVLASSAVFTALFEETKSDADFDFLDLIFAGAYLSLVLGHGECNARRIRPGSVRLRCLCRCWVARKMSGRRIAVLEKKEGRSL